MILSAHGVNVHIRVVVPLELSLLRPLRVSPAVVVHMLIVMWFGGLVLSVTGILSWPRAHNLSQSPPPPPPSAFPFLDCAAGLAGGVVASSAPTLLFIMRLLFP